MAGARKFWRFKGLLPDSHAHQIMAMVAACRGYVEEFLPATTGPEDEEGLPTSAPSSAEFVAAYVTENPSFTVRELVAAGEEAGFKKPTLQSAVYLLKSKGHLIHTGVGAFKVKGAKTHGANGNGNGAGKVKGKRATRGTAEAAVLARIAQGPVAVDVLKQTIIDVGGSPKSISGMLARLTKAKRIKRAEEKGHYVAV